MYFIHLLMHNNAKKPLICLKFYYRNAINKALSLLNNKGERNVENLKLDWLSRQTKVMKTENNTLLYHFLNIIISTLCIVVCMSFKTMDIVILTPTPGNIIWLGNKKRRRSTIIIKKKISFPNMFNVPQPPLLNSFKHT